MHDSSTSSTFVLPVAPWLPRAHQKKKKFIKYKFFVPLCSFNHTPMYKKNTPMYRKRQKRKVNVNSIVWFLSFIMCVCIQRRSERH